MGCGHGSHAAADAPIDFSNIPSSWEEVEKLGQKGIATRRRNEIIGLCQSTKEGRKQTGLKPVVSEFDNSWPYNEDQYIRASAGMPKDFGGAVCRSMLDSPEEGPPGKDLHDEHIVHLNAFLIGIGLAPDLFEMAVDNARGIRQDKSETCIQSTEEDELLDEIIAGGRGLVQAINGKPSIAYHSGVWSQQTTPGSQRSGSNGSVDTGHFSL